MNQREGFKAMNKNVIVLPKRDFNYKPKLVSNEDWKKRFEFFRALAREKTQMRHDLPPLLSRSLLVRFSLLMTPFQFVFWSSSYFPLTLLFAGYSPFYICLFLFSFAFLSPFSAYFSVLFNFLARFFSTRLTPFTSCCLWPLCLFHSSPFSLKTLSPPTWIITISCGWQSFSSAGIVALRVD